MVKERNYLDVFPYDKWSDKELPNFDQGQEFMPSVCELKESQTTRPNLLTEADLVTLMDKNGIGKACNQGEVIISTHAVRLLQGRMRPLPNIYRPLSTENT